ncbi:NAD(P)-binding domain-containing protein [Pseudonocardia xishanensis]|uniref:NAD(P)-binding domain-containing protein n=1 Tax=Pseudonocardia xishanensis TaxID=630995 RepID=UPI0031EBDFDF
MTTVGFIGSGNIGTTIARFAVEAGHQVVLSNSRGPDTIARPGPQASATTSEEAAAAGEIVVMSVPVSSFPHLPTAELAGRTLIDTCSHLLHAPAPAGPAGGCTRPLVPADRRGLRAREGRGDRRHRIPRVRRRGRGITGRQPASVDGDAGVGHPVRIVLERQGPACR